MKIKELALAAFLFAAPALSMASEKVVHLPFQPVVDQGVKSGQLDGSVKFALAGSGSKGKVVNDSVTISRKTNAFGKSDEDTCNHVLLTDLIWLQEQAKGAGANAVTDIVSNYNNVQYRDAQNYECHKGFLMSGVALKAKLVKTGH